MTDESRPILKSLLDLDSYLSTTASEKSATIISDGSNHNQGATVFSWLKKKYKDNWIRKCWNRGSSHRKFHNRIVDRNGDFHQSNGKMAIKKKIRSEDWRALYAGDLFHSLIDSPSSRSIGILLSGYLLLVFIFSLPYYYISQTYGCDMGIDTYQESFAFSLETMATIGYGTQDIFFNNCWSPVIVLACQISCKLIADAVIIGVIYSRFGRPNTRASTILFSNHAVIRRISGKLYFMFQLVELRKHQLIEAQVRLYVIRRDIDPPSENFEENGESSGAENDPKSSPSGGLIKNEFYESKEPTTTNFQTCKMRLNYPDDELGGMLIMCLPQVIVHEIDAGSPLMPPPLWRSCEDPLKSFRWTPTVFDAELDVDTEGQDRHQCQRRQLRRRRDASRLHNSMKYPNVVKRSKMSTAQSNGQKAAAEGGEAKESAVEILSPDELSGKRNSLSAFGMSLEEQDHREISTNSEEHLSQPLLSGTVNSSSQLPRVMKKRREKVVTAVRARGAHEEEKDMLTLFMSDRNAEILAIVEGIDATTGGVVQARHSFICSEVEWHKSFAPCVFVDKSDGSAIIDFSVFHDLIDVSEDASNSGSMPSHT